MKLIKIIFSFGIAIIAIAELIRIIFWMLKNQKLIQYLPFFDYIGLICLGVTLMFIVWNGRDKAAESITNWVFDE